jgi:L-lactate permease
MFASLVGSVSVLEVLPQMKLEDTAQFQYLQANMPLIILAVFLLITSAMCFTVYFEGRERREWKRAYDKSMISIRKSEDELRELDRA